jgi:hypothetical protein
MGFILAAGPGNGHRNGGYSRSSPTARLLLAILIVLTAGCRSLLPVDTRPLDGVGMSYDAVEELKSLRITAVEVTEVAKARQGGFSDANCIDVFKIYHSRNQSFEAGSAIAGLVQANVSEDTILELARIDQLGLAWGELQAMKLAGLSDDILLEVARHRSRGQPVLSGASLAGLRNTGMRESTLFELARRGIPDAQAKAIASYRRRGASDAEILRVFSGS